MVQLLGSGGVPTGVDPNTPKAKGNVEVWFTDLMKAMRLSMKEVFKASIKEYSKMRRGDWVLNWPGQVVLNVSQLYWTNEVEALLSAKGTAGLKEYEAQLNIQLADIVALVRGKLSKMGRTTLGALTVIDVHARDVITEMVEAGVSRVSDFDWMAQLRYSWQHAPDDGYNRYGDDPNNLVAKIVNASQLYGYEYLGNSSRLVITPLTDRCYRTLMSAVYLTYGGAPAGPAGTGKTETTKDLAKAMGIACVVFNCSGAYGEAKAGERQARARRAKRETWREELGAKRLWGDSLTHSLFFGDSLTHSLFFWLIFLAIY